MLTNERRERENKKNKKNCTPIPAGDKKTLGILISCLNVVHLNLCVYSIQARR